MFASYIHLQVMPQRNKWQHCPVYQYSTCTPPQSGTIHLFVSLTCSKAGLGGVDKQGLQQKRLAARRHKTTYAYDFPSVFGNALREQWTARAVAGEGGAQPKGERQSKGYSVLQPQILAFASMYLG